MKLEKRLLKNIITLGTTAVLTFMPIYAQSQECSRDKNTITCNDESYEIVELKYKGYNSQFLSSILEEDKNSGLKLDLSLKLEENSKYEKEKLNFADKYHIVVDKSELRGDLFLRVILGL